MLFSTWLTGSQPAPAESQCYRPRATYVDLFEGNWKRSTARLVEIEVRLIASGKVMRIPVKLVGGEPGGARIFHLIKEMRAESLPQADLPVDFYHFSYGGEPVRHYEHISRCLGKTSLDLVIAEALQPRTYLWRLWKANTRGSQKDLLWANRALRQRYQRTRGWRA